MIATRVAKKLVGGAAVVLDAAVSVVGHVAWYIRYQAEGTAREEEDGETTRA